MTDAPKSRWFYLTPDRLILWLLAIEGLLWLSNRLEWPTWHKGYAVLVTVAAVGVAVLLMGLLVRRCPDLRLTISILHPVAAGVGRGRRRAVQLDDDGDEEGEETGGGGGGDKEVRRAGQVRL